LALNNNHSLKEFIHLALNNNHSLRDSSSIWLEWILWVIGCCLTSSEHFVNTVYHGDKLLFNKRKVMSVFN
jgi:hypothetical protein